MPGDTTAPVTAEGLRERIAEAATRWALMYPIASWRLAEDDKAELLANIWGDQIANAVIAELAGDPGDLPARMTARLVRACTHFADDPECAEMTAAAIMDERWEHAAHIAARLAQAETRAEHAEAGAQISAERLAKAQTERDAKLRTKALGRSLVELEGFAQRETARADAAEGQVERLRAELADVHHDLKLVVGETYTTAGSAAFEVMRRLATAGAERDALKAARTAAWKLHEAIAHGDTTVCAHCSRWDGQRVLGAIPYPCPTIRTLFPPAALDVPETPGDAETEHWGPDPAFGNLTKHIGPREQCSGPDCGPDEEEATDGC
jgi:hypothetical protein